MRREGTPTRRRVVGSYALLGLALIVGLNGLAELLRHDHPAAGPATPELAQEVDPLREVVECPLPQPREGQEQETITSGTTAPVDVSSNQLYDCPTTWDGRLVRYVGEAVGAVLDRGDHAWVQLNDDVYADGVGPLPTHRDFRGGNAGLGVRLPAADAGRIGTVGGPTTRGDLVEAIGTFHRVDADSGEVAVLRADTITILRSGEPFDLPRAPLRPVVASIAAVLALSVLVVDRRRRSR